MADFRARQRVQIHDGTDEFGVLVTKPIFISNSDGTTAQNFTGTSADVNVTNTVTVTAADLDIRDLSVTQDSIQIYANTAKDGTGTDYIPLVDSDGHLQVDILSGAGGGTEYSEDDATPATIVGTANMLERDDVLATLTPVEGDWVGQRSNARGAMWVELDLTNDVTIADGGNSITIDGTLTGITNDVNIADGGNSITVDAVDLDIRDLTSVSDSVEVLQDTHDDLNVNANIQVGDADVDATNPVPVTITSAVSSDEVNDYDTAAAVAKDATDNHDYTVTAAKTLLLKQVIVASSGAMKCEIQVGPVGSLVTKAVIFTSGSKPTETITFAIPIEVPDTSTGTVRVIRRNDDNQAMDVYSTIIGEEV